MGGRDILFLRSATVSNRSIPSPSGERAGEAGMAGRHVEEASRHLAQRRGKSGGKFRPQSLNLAVMEEKCFSSFPELERYPVLPRLSA